MNLYFEKSWITVFNNDNNNKAINFMMKSNTNEEGIRYFGISMLPVIQKWSKWIYKIKNDCCVKIQLSRWLAGVGRVI